MLSFIFLIDDVSYGVVLLYLLSLMLIVYRLCLSVVVFFFYLACSINFFLLKHFLGFVFLENFIHLKLVVSECLVNLSSVMELKRNISIVVLLKSYWKSFENFKQIFFLVFWEESLLNDSKHTNKKVVFSDLSFIYLSVFLFAKSFNFFFGS